MRHRRSEPLAAARLTGRIAGAVVRAARRVRAAPTALSQKSSPRAFRFERFGAIVQLRHPRALVFVDRQMARRLGARDAGAGDTWREGAADGEVGAAPLTAPLEAHLQLTNRCDAGCDGCYTGATAAGAPREWGAAEWKRAIDVLAGMGVFHIALGGGESAVLPWLGEVAAHARRRGVIPNLTTSGLAGTGALVPIAHLFGQINVSLDGIGDTYRAVRGFDGFAAADAAVRALRANKRDIGINVVVTRRNFDEIEQLFAYARARRLSEIELLRFKPAGRGAAAFADLACTDAQHRAFLPAILSACRRHRVRVRVDCSYTPMLAHHQPDPDLLARLAVYGCTGGDFLIGAKASGALTACSFAAAPRERPSVTDLANYWDTPEAFGAFRRWRDAREPCRSCRYHALCRGGCKVVSRHLAGDAALPDPECPRVVDWRAGRSEPRQQAPGPRRRLPVLP